MQTDPRPVRESPGSTAALRQANQQRVIDVLLTTAGSALTQADLSRVTGLAAGTVSNIVRELASGSVLDTVAGAGRRGTLVRLGRGAGLVAGLDFGHKHLNVALADMNGVVLASRRESLDIGHSHHEGLRLASQLLAGVAEDAHVAVDDVRTVGLGLPAPFDEDVVMSSAILPGWVGVNARDAAAQALGRTVVIENDANLGALAEHRRGIGRGLDNLIFVKVSSGVGAGIIVNGHLFRGSNGTAGEIGHLTLNEQGPICRCGSRGCLEAYAGSGPAKAMMAGQMPEASLADIVAAAKEGNVSAIRVFEDAGLHLGWGLGALTNLLNPDLIVVGGDMASAGDLLLEPARQGLRRHCLSGAANTPVVPASLGDRASLVGALVLAIEATDLLVDYA